MKRRLVAVTLSLVMTMATVSEAGAATFTSPDGNSVVAVQAVKTGRCTRIFVLFIF